MFHRYLTALLFSIAAPVLVLGEDHFIPFEIPAVANPDSLSAFAPSAPILPDSPHVVARDAHFFVGDKRIKFWSVNFTFAANFPTHANAEAVALRLSQAGINCVRFHHMDTQTWATQSGIWSLKNPRLLSREALDRLDYLIAQLAKRGIYADLNLHVGRTHSEYLRLPNVPTVPWLGFDKIIDIFTPELIAAQKDYATQLLTHTNPYRAMRYTDDPVVALVEINNEDSLFMWGAAQHLRTLPDPYATLLRSLFNKYLKSRYPDTAHLRDAWNQGSVPLGDELLHDLTFTDLDPAAAHDWLLEIHPGNQARLIHPDSDPGAAKLPAARIDITTADSTAWHLQFQQPNLKFTSGSYYTLEFKARADRPRPLAFGVAQAHEPWNNLGLSGTVDLTPQWQTFRYGFTATETDDKARLSFQVGGVAIPVDLASISLRPGGKIGLAPDESLEAANVALFPTVQTDARNLDTMTFLAQTDKSYWDSMRTFLKKDLGSKSLITGTIAMSTLGLYGQSDMDFIDSHSYWQHPQFPGRPWDPANWTVEQKAMFEHPEEAILFHLAAHRLVNKPFTVTEYCHPAPNDYQAECVPELATFAAAQDWDGVFLFDYGRVPNADHITSYFSIGENPAKWAFMSSGAAVFRGGGIPPMDSGKTVYLFQTPGNGVANLKSAANRNLAVTPENNAFPLAPLIDAYQLHDGQILAADNDLTPTNWKSLVTDRLYQSLDPHPPSNDDYGLDPGSHLVPGSISWTHNTTVSEYFALSARSLTWIGCSGVSLPGTSVTLSSPAFGVIMMVSLDAADFGASHKILITACGRAQSTNMAFSTDRRTVGWHWGTAPVLVEPVHATIIMPGNIAPGRWHLTALSPTGLPVGDSLDIDAIPGPDSPSKITLPGTSAWYILTR